MSENRFQHVDMRVSDLDAAIPFYSALLPALGFFLTESSPDWRVFQAEGEPGARNISGPRACPEYSSSYYASFFEDPCGNCLEICYQID